MASDTQWRIAKLPSNAEGQTKHTMNGEPMPPTKYVLLAEYPDGPMVFRYSGDWDFAGDTWHECVANAMHQVEWEFSCPSLKWKLITEQEAEALMKGE